MERVRQAEKYFQRKPESQIIVIVKSWNNHWSSRTTNGNIRSDSKLAEKCWAGIRRHRAISWPRSCSTSSTRSCSTPTWSCSTFSSERAFDSNVVLLIPILWAEQRSTAPHCLLQTRSEMHFWKAWTLRINREMIMRTFQIGISNGAGCHHQIKNPKVFPLVALSHCSRAERQLQCKWTWSTKRQWQRQIQRQRQAQQSGNCSVNGPGRKVAGSTPDSDDSCL